MPKKRTESKMATSPLPSQGARKEAKLLRNTLCFSRVPGTANQIRSGYISPAFLGGGSGQYCWLTTVLSGAPGKGVKIRSGYITGAFSGARNRAKLRRNPCVLGGPQEMRQNDKGLPTHPTLDPPTQLLTHPGPPPLL